MNLIQGDCIEVMQAMDAESVDSICTDPPYGLEFMGKEWDKLDGNAPPGYVETPRMVEHRGLGGYRQRPNFFVAGQRAQAWHQQWAEAAYRVAKPSAYLLAFGGTRTVHRMTVAIEDAGWIIRDMLVWAYASGFPKSKASLKPAWEPIVMARKPGPLRMLAIDECRIGTDEVGAPRGDVEGRTGDHGIYRKFAETGGSSGNGATSSLGRWPANVILTDPIFDGGWEGVVGGGRQDSPATYERSAGTNRNMPHPMDWDNADPRSEAIGYGDSGTYSRFFLIPKADRTDREPVLGGLPTGPSPHDGHFRAEGRSLVDGEWVGTGTANRRTRANVHPTVKPVDLMRHLVRLVTPTGGTVLDPFLGSGTTAIAAEMEGFEWIGIEKEREYCDIAEARLNGTQRGLGLDSPAPTPVWKDYPTATRYPVKGPSQSSWFTESTRGAAAEESGPVGGVDLQLFSGMTGPAEGEEVG